MGGGVESETSLDLLGHYTGGWEVFLGCCVRNFGIAFACNNVCFRLGFCVVGGFRVGWC